MGPGRRHRRCGGRCDGFHWPRSRTLARRRGLLGRQGEEDKVADNRTTVEKFLRAMAANDIEAQERLLSDDFVEEYPQSGERIRGKDNRRAIIENYPVEHREKRAPRTPIPSLM